MNRAELAKPWEELATAKFVGRTIVEARYMTDKEVEASGWPCGSIVMSLDDGSFFWPSTDDEGNGPGALFTSHNDLQTVPVL